jgi:hypothetical protein
MRRGFMPETEEEKNHATTVRETIIVPYGKMTLMAAVMFLGLLLVVIGLDRNNDGVYYAGAFLLPAAFIWGGLFLKEESSGIRVTLLAVGGYLIASLLAGAYSIFSSLHL